MLVLIMRLGHSNAQEHSGKRFGYDMSVVSAVDLSFHYGPPNMASTATIPTRAGRPGLI